MAHAPSGQGNFGTAPATKSHGTPARKAPPPSRGDDVLSAVIQRGRVVGREIRNGRSGFWVRWAPETTCCWYSDDDENILAVKGKQYGQIVIVDPTRNS